MSEALAEAGREFCVVLTSHNVGAIASAVENGLGVALPTAESIRPRTMRVLPLAPGGDETLSVRYGLYAARRRNGVNWTVVDLLRQSIGVLAQAPVIGG